jgi:peptide subunit release factor 1 (eRF1)
MISLIIPPGDQISRVAKMLADEYGTASNIKSRVNRLSVLSAITSTQARLKLYTKGKDREKKITSQANSDKAVVVPFCYCDYCYSWAWKATSLHIL